MYSLEQYGRTLPRGEDLLTGGVPAYGVYGTSDGRWLAAGALEDKFWRLLCATIGREDLAPHGLATGAEGSRVRRELEGTFGAGTLAHWTRVFENVDCCVTPILTLDEALDDAQFAARGMVVERDGLRQYAPPFRVSGPPLRNERPAPAHGEHTVEVLREAGVDEATIAILATRTWLDRPRR